MSYLYKNKLKCQKSDSNFPYIYIYIQLNDVIIVKKVGIVALTTTRYGLNIALILQFNTASLHNDC